MLHIPKYTYGNWRVDGRNCHYALRHGVLSPHLMLSMCFCVCVCVWGGRVFLCVCVCTWQAAGHIADGGQAGGTAGGERGGGVYGGRGHGAQVRGVRLLV